MSDENTTETALKSPPMGDFDESGDYIPRQITENDLGSLSLDEAYSATMVGVEAGQLVEGTVVRVDKDEALLDIGYKSEGVIPARELSIRNGVNPADIVSMGEKLELSLIHI